MQDNILLSPHFELREFTESPKARKYGIVNEPPPEAIKNLKALCVHTLEPLREALGLPIVITSGYRTKELNSLLAHSSKCSQHMVGRAADFYVAPGPFSGSNIQDSGSGNQSLNLETGASPMKLETSSRRELLIRAFRQIITDDAIAFDQLIIYPSFIHVSYVSKEKNRRKITTANGQGTYCAVSREQALVIV